MPLITLVGRVVSRVGSEFVYTGPMLPECKGCKIISVCFNLSNGKHYRVIATREKSHDCAVNEDKMRIVEVKEVSYQIVLPKRLAIDGSTITYELPGCKKTSCEHYHNCMPYGLSNGTKLKVTKVMGKVDCAIGNNVVLVEVI